MTNALSCRRGRASVLAATGCALALVLFTCAGLASARALPAAGILATWGQGTSLPGPVSTTADTTGVDESLMSATAAGAGWVVSGSGWGHGVGMSQYGAMEMAKDGFTAREILAHYYTGSTYDAVLDEATIHVNLRNAVAASTVTATDHGATLSVPGSTTRMVAPAGAAISVTRSGAGVGATCTTCTPAALTSPTYLEIDWPQATGNTIAVDGARYEFGDVLVWPTPGSPTTEVVIRVRLHDQYLDYVREVPWSWPAAALQAQASAVRGYALTQPYKNGDRPGEGTCMCHLYDDTRSQVFGGYPSSADQPYWQAWKGAVRATATSSTGYVVRYAGAVIRAFYSSSSGGRTQNNEDVWGGTPLPYLRSVHDPWSERPSNPNSSWRATVTGGSLASAFGLPDVARLDLRDRTGGNGVDVAKATSTAGVTATIDGELLQSRLGLKSTYVRHLGTRIGGANRYEVAAGVAQRITGTATTAVIASGEPSAVFDASVSGPLSATVGGPLLLTPRSRLPPAALAELDRRRSNLTRILVVGGPASVSDDVLASIRQRYPSIVVERIGGSTRYDVARNVCAEIDKRRAVGAVVVASGLAIADALAASGPASALYHPILLTSTDALPLATSAALSSTGATVARIVGGPSSVSTTVEAQLRDRGLTVGRLGGSDRYEVAANVATYFRANFAAPTEVIMTSGAEGALADSLAAGSLRKLMVLTRPYAVPEATLRFFQTTGLLETVTVVGGPASVPDGILSQAQTS